MNTVIIGVGSNIEPGSNIREAIRLVCQGALLLGVSTFKKTSPIGIENQPDFINGAIKISTPMQKEQLQELLKTIENQLGRNRELPKFGPRTIDLDIVVWNGEIVDEDYFSRGFLREFVGQLLDNS